MRRLPRWGFLRPTVGAGTYMVAYTIDDVCVDADEMVVVVPLKPMLR